MHVSCWAPDLVNILLGFREWWKSIQRKSTAWLELEMSSVVMLYVQSRKFVRGERHER